MAQENLKELQGALRQKMSDNKSIADSFKVEEGTVVIDQKQKSAFDANMKDIKELKGLIDGMEAMEQVQQWGSQASDTSVAAAAAAGYSIPKQQLESIGESFLASAEFKALAGGRNGANMPAPFQYNGRFDTSGGYSQKDAYTAMPSGFPTQFGSVQRDPIVIPPRRTKRVRDLFPVRTTTSAIIEYFRMTGFTNNAGMVPERNGDTFAAKPQSSMTFEGVQTSTRTMAHWEAAHRNVLADEPQLRSIIDNELMYGLRLQEDYQILNGDGTGENLQGILTTPGIQTYNWSMGATLPVVDTKADAIRRAATLSFLAYYEPSGVVLHPNDWEDIEMTKDNNGQYLIAVSVALGGEPKVWRLPIVETPAMTEGVALIGSFGQGAQIYDREQASIRISEQHADFFIRNAIVILAEQRLALAVKRPESFVKLTFNNAPA